MKIFECSHCSRTVFFENNHCGHCGHSLGYLDTSFELFALDPNFREWYLPDTGNTLFAYCRNHLYGTCNWLVPVSKASGFCPACELNRKIPNLNDRQNLEQWKEIEIAKHRLVFQLQRLGLPTESKHNFPETGLVFDFISKKDATGQEQNVMTGHADGVITIMLSEADSVQREEMKSQMEERYRTLIGHFRHEVGHYYWDRLIKNDPNRLQAFRGFFGDERESYAEALQRHYSQGPRGNWQQNFISEYASAHSWEDWAETWAHYLHIMDTLETAYCFGLKISPQVQDQQAMSVRADFDPYQEQDFDKISKACISIYYAMNSINRSMGITDIYPFVISKPVIEKMAFIHRALQNLV